MPLYTFRCRRGHVTEAFRPAAESQTPIRCDACGGRARRDLMADVRGVGVKTPAPIHQHFNRSFGTVVSGREHLEALQKKKGYSDYDPKFMPGPSTGWE